MSSFQFLCKLRSVDLTTLLNSIGSRSTGTKGVLVQQLLWDCKIAKLRGHPSIVASAKSRPKETTRILSIDMGIKNLAFCVCDVPAFSAPTKAINNEMKRKEAIGSTLRLSVVAWKRIAVTGSTTPIGRKKKDSSKNLDVEEKIGTPKAYVEEDDPFSPKQLAKTAYKLVSEVLLPYNPDTILIERQRFRSGNGSAVQEWTVRVNMFESMIWAVLTTLKNEGMATPTKSGSVGEGDKGEVDRPQLWDVSPKRVASFWIRRQVEKIEARGVSGIRDAKKRGVKVEKREKVDLVQRWILADAGGIEVNEAVDIAFEDEAARTRDAFMAEKSGPYRKPVAQRKIEEFERKKQAKGIAVPVVELPEAPGLPSKKLVQEPLLDIGKLDDLADCLLQAGAWTKWEMNKRELREIVEGGDFEKLNEWVHEQD